MHDLMWEPKLPPLQLIPPREAESEGLVQEAGPYKDRIIYTQKMVDVDATKANKKVKIDPVTGEEVWKKNHLTGEKMYPIMEVETVFKVDRYILQPKTRSRSVAKVRNFEMTAAERAEIARRESERTFLDEFVSAAAAEGLSPAQLVRHMKSQMLDIGEDEDALSVTVGGEEVTEEVIQAKMAELADPVEDDGGVMEIERELDDVLEDLDLEED